MKINKKNYIQQLRAHNEQALQYVIDEYGGLLTAIIRKHLYALPQMQEECFDDVLLKIWQNISAFDESKSTFQNWAAAVARYRAIDYLRQAQRELEEISLEGIMVSREDKELSRLIEKEISRETGKMLQCLKPRDRKLFTKLYVEEKSIKQVSAETGLKKEVIYNRVSRGKQKINKLYPRNSGKDRRKA